MSLTLSPRGKKWTKVLDKDCFNGSLLSKCQIFYGSSRNKLMVNINMGKKLIHSREKFEASKMMWGWRCYFNVFLGLDFNVHLLHSLTISVTTPK